MGSEAGLGVTGGLVPWALREQSVLEKGRDNGKTVGETNRLRDKGSH